MKAQKYTVMISGGWLEYNHGMSYPITEIYIPKLKVCINVGDGNFNIIVNQSKPRNPVDNSIEEIEISDDIIDLILGDVYKKSQYEKSHNELAKKIKLLFKELKK